MHAYDESDGLDDDGSKPPPPQFIISPTLEPGDNGFDLDDMDDLPPTIVDGPAGTW